MTLSYRVYLYPIHGYGTEIRYADGFTTFLPWRQTSIEAHCAAFNACILECMRTR